MALVLDSSALITLAAGGALSLLRQWPGDVCTVTEVFQETVEVGGARAFPDASAIARCFQGKTVSVRDPRRRDKLSGLSETDSLIVRLAVELSGRLLANDQTLRRKAEQRGVSAAFTVEFVQDLYEKAKLSRRRRDQLFTDFVAGGRYSREFMDAFLSTLP